MRTTTSSTDDLPSNTPQELEMKRPLMKRGGSFNHYATNSEHGSSSLIDEAARQEDHRITLLHAATALASLPLAGGRSSIHKQTQSYETATTKTVHKTMAAAVALLDAGGCVAKTKMQPKTFPEILMDVLSFPESRGMIEWLPDSNGKAFIILEPFDLATDILPRFFKQSQFESFVRKLNRWGFRRVQTKGISSSQDHGSFFHDMFVRDRPELCSRMRCKARGIGNGQNYRSQQSQSTAARANIAAAKRSPQRQVSPPLSTGPVTEAAQNMRAALSATTGVAGPVNPLKLGGSGLHNVALMPALSLNRHVRSAHPSAAGYGSSGALAEVVAARRRAHAIANSDCSSAAATSPEFSSLSSLLAKRNATLATLALARVQVAASLTARPSSMRKTATTPEDKVAASFLRHQRLLRMTQRSRAMLRQSGLLGGPSSM